MTTGNPVETRPLPSPHTKFFSSLKQVEKRLKLEQPSQPTTVSQQQLTQGSNNLTLESLSSPLYIHFDHANNNNNNNNNSTIDSSEPPHAFLSCSPQYPPTHDDPSKEFGRVHPKTIIESEAEAMNHIEQLVQLLCLSDSQQKAAEKEKERVAFGLKIGPYFGGKDGSCNSCHCEGGFYSKIVGLKGPKCEKEVERLESWIKYFMNGGGEEKIEPFRLSHLLLGKAAFLSEVDDDILDVLDFPSTIEEFLLNEPPTH